jgi:ABC-type transport system involved in Fe-S cluster assembly fused permease/ATPase subunit
MSTLILAYMSIRLGELSISDFVVFNQYILQVYFPLGFLGTYWRFIRQAWSDIELVLDILSVDETIKEIKNPIKANIHSGEIEFKNVSFSYDSEMKQEDRR